MESIELRIEKLEEEKKTQTSSFVKELIQTEIDSLARKLKKKSRKQNREVKYLVYEDFVKLISVIETRGRKNWLRDKLIFLLAFECGLRASEVCNLLITDYSASNKGLFCRRGKGSNNNTIRLSTETATLLDTYLEQFPGKTEYIFESNLRKQLSRFSLGSLCKTYFSLANLPESKAHFHTMKHSAGVYYAEQGLDIKDVQFLLGHKSVDSTLIYFEYTTKQQEALYQKMNR